MNKHDERFLNEFAEDYLRNIQERADVWWPHFVKYLHKSRHMLHTEHAVQAYLVWMMVLDWVGGKEHLPEVLHTHALAKIAHSIGYSQEHLLRWQAAAQNFFAQEGLTVEGPRLFDVYLEIYRHTDGQLVPSKEKKVVYDLVDYIGVKIKSSSILEHFADT